MASARALAWLERLVWTLIYGGLFAVVLGLAVGQASRATAWSLVVAGALATAVGIVLVWVRSRLRETPTGGAQSSEHPSRGTP
jgi:hypothetical protein